MTTNDIASVPLLQYRKKEDASKQHEYGSFEDFVGANKAWCKLCTGGSVKEILEHWGLGETSLLISYTGSGCDDVEDYNRTVKPALVKIIRSSAAWVLTNATGLASDVLHAAVHDIEAASDYSPIAIGIFSLSQKEAIETNCKIKSCCDNHQSYAYLSHFIFYDDATDSDKTRVEITEQISKNFKVPVLSLVNVTIKNHVQFIRMSIDSKHPVITITRDKDPYEAKFHFETNRDFIVNEILSTTNDPEKLFEAIIKTILIGKDEHVDYLKMAVVLNAPEVTVSAMISSSLKWKSDEDICYRQKMLSSALAFDYGETTLILLRSMKEIDLRALDFGKMSHKSMARVEKYLQATVGVNMKIPKGKSEANDCAYVWLFIWAICNERFDVANALWTLVDSKMAAALLASRCLDSMRKNTVDGNQRDTLNQNWSLYTDRANTILDNCFSAKRTLTKAMLVKCRETFGDSSALLIGKTNKKFIENRACQAKLNDIWMGPLKSDQDANQNWKIAICLALPILSSILLHFKEDKGQQKCCNVYSRSFCGKVCHFMNSPIVKFLYCTVSYLVFLLFYAHEIMFKIYENPTVIEYLLMAWVVAFLTEEIKQFIEEDVYFRDAWNWLDLAAIVLFCGGTCLRFLTCCLDIGRVLLAMSFMLFSLRLLHVFSSLKVIGPLLVMIGRMLKDLVQFLLILAVVYISFAVTMQAILYPMSSFEFQTMQNALKRPYWSIFGQLEQTLDEFQGVNCDDKATYDSTDSKLQRCPTKLGTYIAPVLLAIFMLIVQILLLNLLIAMFSYSFTKIHHDTDRHWCYLRFRLIHAYYHLPTIPPPFSAFYNVYVIVTLVFRRCKRDSTMETSAFCEKLNKNENEKLQRWETIHSCDETAVTPKPDLQEESKVSSPTPKYSPPDTVVKKVFFKNFKSKILRNQISRLNTIDGNDE
ncbi:transient receptor potential cation channel subfamily M member-like 2 [Dreissena polymorpha]|uniref:Uncharacterized protein n=1 Tax=Dreissena polymorpha TaxID=45954 RepID=A0A9D4HI36_DREPO|nr:transient receptor potential cation channel subfamily M member-like 2 [Dreissena polymorpha]KAH3718233.1 hypothetical protein DPMN_061033 [Dreissena polymorpha]